MKYCAKCGAEVSENSKFCEKCGNKVNEDFPDNRSKKIRAGKIVAVAVVAAIIAVAGYLQHSRSQKDSNLAKEASADTNEDTYEISHEDRFSAEGDNVKYIDGAYTSSIQLNDNSVDIEVVVEENHITSITLVNMDETSSMYPLMQPALDNLTQQIYKKQSLENISYGDDNQYTSMVLLNAIESALDKARYEKE